MRNRFRKRAVSVVAVATIGIALLSGCTSATPKSQPTMLTTKAAGAYYLATTCKANAKADLYADAISIARQSSANTGPDLDNLKSAAGAYLQASQDAAVSLDNPMAAWPASVRKSILVVRKGYMAERQSLQDLYGATSMSAAAAAASEFPDPSKANAASNLIRSKLGLPSSDSANSCPPPALSAAPATGMLITGTGYTFHAPAGWTLPTKAVQGDSYAISAKPDAKGFYDTINVVIRPSNKDSLSAEELNGAEYLLQVTKATAVQVRPRVEIAGEEGVHISSLTNHGGVRRNEQYLVTRDGMDLYVTFNFDPAESQTDREALAESVLASWTWV
jgi:hypothetical protein